MLGMSAVTAIDGIFVGHSVGSEGIAAINIVIPVLMLMTGIGLMIGTGCSVVSSIHLSRGRQKVVRLNVTQAMLFVTIIIAFPTFAMLGFPEETAPSVRFVRASSAYGQRIYAMVRPFVGIHDVDGGSSFRDTSGRSPQTGHDMQLGGGIS